MKKLLVLALVLGFSAVASASMAPAIGVVPVDIGQSEGRLGGPNDPLWPSDTIGLAIVLGLNPHPVAPPGVADGFATDAITLGLALEGPGTLGVGQRSELDPVTFQMVDVDDLHRNDAFGVWAESAPLIQNNAIAKMSGGVLDGAITGETVLIDNLLFHCDGDGNVLVDLTLAGTTQIFDDWNRTNNSQISPPRLATEGDLGDLVIHQIPEPMTMSLLGLGGLALIRRRRA